MDTFQLIATATAGLEACVKRELLQLGFADARVRSPGRLQFTADAEGLARANLWLRTAGRVLLLVGEFSADNFDDLFERAMALPWERWIPADGAFPVRGRSHHSQLSSVPACQRAVKKAIVETLRASHNVSDLPETGPACAVEIALRDNTATLTIDTSGDDLHKRGYRAAAGPAPLKETLAAAMVQLSFWDPQRPLVDPFCGSGTIPIEAALIARNVAPGLKRRFAAEAWPAFGAAVWDAQRQAAIEQIQPAPRHRIIATDIEPKAISLASYHAELAGVADDIHFQEKPFAELTSNRSYGCVICNPPYGHRFENTAEIAAIYRSMPEVFRRLETWSFYVLTSVDLEGILGQPADRRRKLYNGRIECTYYQYHGPRPPKTLSPEQRAERDAAGPAATRPPRETPVPAFGGLADSAANQAEMFANRLRKNARALRRWPSRRGITCYRLYDRDIPEIPLAVDLYDNHLHIAEYDRPHDRTPAQNVEWLELMAQTAGDTLDVPLANIHLKRRQRQRGAAQYGKFAQTGCTLTVTEDGLQFEVNLSEYLDTGLFLDHRLTRRMVRDESADKRVLNLFAYTGAFSVYAAAGAAAQTTTVDLSKTYLAWAQRNMAANGFTGPAHRFIQSDALAFVRGASPNTRYDLAVIDPPTFSTSKRTDDAFDVQHDHVELLTATMKLMSPGGVIYFSTNFRTFKFDPAALPGLDAAEITDKTIPEDFRNKRIHRCWRMVVASPEVAVGHGD